MPRRLFISFFAIAVVIAALVLAARPASESSASVVLDSEEAAFLTLINNYRASQDPPIGPLQIDYDIQAAAEWMSADMGQYGYFSHTDSLGQSPWTRMCNFGYCFSTYKGENIAAGYGTAAQVFEGWRNSSGHNANMLNSNFNVMGIGRVTTPGSPYTTYWTNDFGGYVNPDGLLPPSDSTNTPAPTASPTPTPTPAPVTATATPTPTAVPATATPTQTPSPTPACPGDADCDGWTDLEEMYVGTNPWLACSLTTQANDESYDALPADMNDDRRVDMADVLAFSGRLGVRGGDPLYTMRLDLTMDDVISLGDVLRMSAFYGTTC